MVLEDATKVGVVAVVAVIVAVADAVEVTTGPVANRSVGTAVASSLNKSTKVKWNQQQRM